MAASLYAGRRSGFLSAGRRSAPPCAGRRSAFLNLISLWYRPRQPGRGLGPGRAATASTGSGPARAEPPHRRVACGRRDRL